MAKKIRGFGELLKGKKKAQAQRKNLEKLAQKVQRGPFQNLSPEVRFEPPGTAKMSEVLEDFVSPYLPAVSNKQAHNKLLKLAIVAWNTALLPEADQSKILEEVIEAGQFQEDSQVRQNIRNIIEEMIDRKRRYFSKYRRYIVDFTLQGTGQDLHLSVASTPAPSEAPK